jgi:hypothetical protein
VDRWIELDRSPGVGWHRREVGLTELCRERDEGNDVDDSEPGMGPGVLGQVEHGRGACRHRPGSLFDDGACASKGEDRPVVPMVSMDVDEYAAEVMGDALEAFVVPALADVDDALEQRFGEQSGRAVRQGHRRAAEERRSRNLVSMQVNEATATGDLPIEGLDTLVNRPTSRGIL